MNWTPVVQKRVVPSPTIEGINTHSDLSSNIKVQIFVNPSFGFWFSLQYVNPSQYFLFYPKKYFKTRQGYLVVPYPFGKTFLVILRQYQPFQPFWPFKPISRYFRHLQPLTAIFSHLQLFTAIFSNSRRLQPLQTIYSHLQPCTAIHAIPIHF